MNWAMEHENDGDISQQRKMKHKGKHDKPKPRDDDSNIDHWKIDKFNLSWNETGMLEVSSFSILFPRYREKYLQEVWPTVKPSLKEYGISCELNLVEGSMTVSTPERPGTHILSLRLGIVLSCCQEVFLFIRKNVKQKKVKTKEKKTFTPFPPPQQPSKIDEQLASGEFIMSLKKKSSKKWQEKQEKQTENRRKQKKKRS